MPAPIRTLAETIGWEQARLGRSRLTQNDWAAGASIDDCALFQSTAVFGQKAAWNVDVFKTLDGGAYHPGKAGLQAGDVVLFDWNGNGVADHTELALSSPDAGGNFQTIGANGSDTIAVAYRTRNSYVLGYFRPSYPQPPAPAQPAPAPTPTEEDEMLFLIMINDGENKYGGGAFAAITGPGYWYTVKGMENANTASLRFGRAINVPYKEWDEAYAAAVNTGFKPREGQTSDPRS
jgi:hypothetical protein